MFLLIKYFLVINLIYEKNWYESSWWWLEKGIDLNGTPIPLKMLELYNMIMNEENKRERSGVKKSMRNRCVKTGSKHFDKETLDKLLIDSGWEGLREKEILFFYE